ncbi:MAG: 50S ribosomal protein L10 [Coriobacteriales bacterium]
MPNIQKEEMVRTIKKELEDATAVWVVDYKGLTVKESEEFRRSIRETGASCKVLKNTLTLRALSELEMPTLEDILNGPSAFIFASGDPVASAKAVKEFSKSNENVVIKGGIMDGKEVSAEEVDKIAELPTREELIAMLLRTMQGPATGLVRVLNGPMESFARVLNAIKDTKVA